MSWIVHALNFLLRQFAPACVYVDARERVLMEKMDDLLSFISNLKLVRQEKESLKSSVANL